jgi:hypothetical protein
MAVEAEPLAFVEPAGRSWWRAEVEASKFSHHAATCCPRKPRKTMGSGVARPLAKSGLLMHKKNVVVLSSTTVNMADSGRHAQARDPRRRNANTAMAFVTRVYMSVG